MGWRWAEESLPRLHACPLFLMLCGSLWSLPASVPCGPTAWPQTGSDGLCCIPTSPCRPLPLLLHPPSCQQHTRRPRLPHSPPFTFALCFPPGCGHLEVSIAQVVPLLGHGPPLADRCLSGQTLLSLGNTIILMGQDGCFPRMGFVFLKVSQLAE